MRIKSFFLTLAALTLCASARAQVPPGIHVTPAVWAECQKGIDIGRCASTIKPQPCPTGQHWSLKGTGYAHCVLTTTPCPAGGYQTEDFYGNLSCQAAGSLSTSPKTPLKRPVPTTPPPTPVAAFAMSLDEMSSQNVLIASNPVTIVGANASNLFPNVYANMLNQSNQIDVNRHLQASVQNAIGAVNFTWTIQALSDLPGDYSSRLLGGGPLGDWSPAARVTSGYYNTSSPAGGGLYNAVSRSDVGTRSMGTDSDYFRSALVTVTAVDSGGNSATRSVTIHTHLSMDDTLPKGTCMPCGGGPGGKSF